MVVFQALTWETQDDDQAHLVRVFGKTFDGKSVCVTTEFKPYFYVKLPRKDYKTWASIWYQKICRLCPALNFDYTIIKSKDVWGFQDNEEFYFMKLEFETLGDRRKVSYKIKNRALPDEYKKLKVYESNLDPVLRLMHRTGIQSTGWLDTGDSCYDNNVAYVDIDLSLIHI